MKVSSVGFFNLNALQFKKEVNENAKSATLERDGASFRAGNISYPQAYPIITSPAFTGAKGVDKIKTLAFKNMRGLPDPISGLIMVPYTQFVSSLTQKALSGTSRQAIKTLSEFDSNMFPVEKNIFDLLSTLSKKAPRKTLQELLVFLKPMSLEKLQKKQLAVLKNIENVSQKLSPDSSKKYREMLEKSKELILKDDIGPFFKRKTFINKLSSVMDEIPEKEQALKIIETAKKLPGSSDDMDSFIVKYSRRNSFEIGRRLVNPSVATIEHIKPLALGGDDLSTNKIMESFKHNNEKSCSSLIEQIEKYPQMVKNVQKHIDVVISSIKSGAIVGYDWYPAAMQKTFLQESGGLIKLRIPKEYQNVTQEQFLPLKKEINNLELLVNTNSKTNPEIKSQEKPHQILFTEPKEKAKRHFEDISKVIKKIIPQKNKKILSKEEAIKAKQVIKQVNDARVKMAKGIQKKD